MGFLWSKAGITTSGTDQPLQRYIKKNSMNNRDRQEAFMKKLVLLALLMLVGAADAATIRYHGDGPWEWLEGVGQTNGWQSAVPPGPGDTVRANWGGATITLDYETTVGKFQAGVDDSGTFHILSGGILNTAIGNSKIGNNGACTGTMIIDAGGTVNSTGWLMIAGNTTVSGVVEVSGTLNSVNHLWMATQAGSTATLDINGGTVNVNANIGLGTVNAADPGGVATVNVNSGTLNLHHWSYPGSIQDGSVLNIELGVVTVLGNVISNVADFVSAGKIVAYDGTGTVYYDTTTNPGKTTIWADPEPSIPPGDGDVNQDGYVNGTDLLLVAVDWLDPDPDPEADISRDGNVDYADFAILAGNWGEVLITGSVTVNISGTVPPGGLWCVDGVGPWYNSGDTVSDITVGDHTIIFADIPGYDKPADEPVYVPYGGLHTTETLVTMSSSVWEYLYDGTDQGTGWRDHTGGWDSGPGQLGFGDGDEATDIGPQVDNWITAYFRHEFSASDVSEIAELEIDLLYDDGAVIYINDQEIERLEMPDGDIFYSTQSNGSTNDNKLVTFSEDASTLVEGDNILAVEVHQNGETSSDISFDLGLEATSVTGGSGPAVVNAGAYVQQFGSLLVNITPQGAIDAGAKWRVDGGVWRDSGDEIVQPVATYIVDFSSVFGWQRPASVEVDVLDGAQSVLNEIYLPVPSTGLQINELMADNDSRSPLDPSEILDGDLMSSDWIEIYNNSISTVNLDGKYLTDEADQKTKWQFPAGTGSLGSGEYLVVFASGKTEEENPGNYPYVDPAGYLHTNFELNRGGEYLGLIDNDGITVIHEFNEYPDQEENFSYGIYISDPSYFSEATPGEANMGEFEAFVERPDVNIRGGCYESAIDVTLTCGTEGAFIRYTTDGTVPSLTNGTDYTDPIHIDSLTTIITKGFKTDFYPSDARIETYIFVDPAVAVFNSNLPIIVIDTHGVDIPRAKDQPPEVQYIDCKAVIIDVDDVTGRAEITGPEHFEGIGQIKYRGESTYGSKRHFAFEVQDEYGQDNETSLLGIPAESDWVITADHLDYTFLKCEIAFKWFREMGHYSPRQRYVEMYLNEDGGEVSTGDYRGIFVLRERIKRDQNRVDIERLDALHNDLPQVSGGYIVKADKADPDVTYLCDGPNRPAEDLLETEPYGIHTTGNSTTILVDPGYGEVTLDQTYWIADYINETSSVLWQNTGSIYYPGPGYDYSDYLDVTSWIDHFIVEETTVDADAFWGSYFTHKGRDGKHHSGPVWDFDRAFHNNVGKYGAEKPYDVWKSNNAIFGRWHQKLDDYLEYRIALADRWFEHREDITNTAQTLAHIDETVTLISEAMDRSIAKYGAFPGQGGDYAGEIVLLKDWITNRLDWLDGEFAYRFAKAPPVLDPLGGYVSPSEILDMSVPLGGSGDIYYTLNGEDPRLEGGGINPNASIFGGEWGVSPTADFESDMGNWINVSGDTDDWYRWFGPTPSSSTGPNSGANGSSWYMYMETSSEGCPDAGDTAILEGPSVMAGTDLELSFYYHMYGMHIGTLYVDVYSGSSWTEGVWSISGQQHSSSSDPYTHATVDLSAFAIPLKVRFRGVAAGGPAGDMAIDDIDIIGVSIPEGLTLPKSTCVKARIKDGNEWSAMNTEVYGIGPVLENLRITELMYHPTDPTPGEIAALEPDPTAEDFEFIEIKNIGGAAINLNLVHFTDGIDFTFGDYTLGAGEYAVVVKNQAAFAERYGTGMNIIPGSYAGYLNNGGEEIVLRDAIGAEIHDFDYEDGWYELTDGYGYSLTLVDPTNPDLTVWDSKPGWRSSLYVDGTPGQGPETVLEADSIVINELLAHSHAVNPDWIELYNTTGSPIDISGWFLSDDDSSDINIKKYEFQPGSIIPAYGYLTLDQDVSFGNPVAPGCNIAFGYSEGGETAYLYSGAGGVVTGLYQTQQKFDASETEVTFGRYEKAELGGGYDFVRQISPTKGAVNSGPLIPDIVITEIYYHPPTSFDYEFVELYNRTGSAVTLEETVLTETSPGNFVPEVVTWRLEGTGYEFPFGVTIPAYSYILVAKNPTNYSSAPCPVYGPYDGKLSNGGEEIEIQIPGDQEYGLDRYQIPIEKVDYSDGSHPVGDDPWPTSADGDGDSLNRDDINAYSRDYSNWSAAAPTPGS